ncbi:MBL fold metallo-hydrolase [Streptococcus sp. DD12]|uniref:MBL fold metallo-hydrolase n=1 Tax=Streptococcus sp. DD12 TaxID=1777880 RepID=UPI0007976296|nr:MBL fold metallo-hydrolase [Streptococcus sp. DD12]KXT75746.1 Hydroxyacylglutathione hydrolase [Streptococcus sp. DD12]
MKITKTTNKRAQENTYYLENDQALLIVDPGSDWEVIRQTIEGIEKPLAAVLLTHTHYDHIMSLDKVRETFGHPPVYVSEKEADWLYTPVKNLSGLDRHADMADIVLEPATDFFESQKDYDLAGFHFHVRETPGHSIGGVSLVFPKEELVLTGDALFCESIGRSDLPTGNQAQLLDSIQNQLFSLPRHYRVFPGHGPETSIGHEKTFNPFF